MGELFLKKMISLLFGIVLLTTIIVACSNSKEKVIEPETPENKDSASEEVIQSEEKAEEVIEGNDDSFTLEPFTLTLNSEELIEKGQAFEVEAKLKNTYTGPVTLSAGSKCTEEVTLVLVPFHEYEEGQPAPECKDSTEEVELLVGESMVTSTEFTAEKEGFYILSAYFANFPLQHKVISVGHQELKEEKASNNLGSLHLDVTAEGSFKPGDMIYLTSKLSNKGDNYIRMNENSCKHDFEFSAKVDGEKVEIPGSYGPCEDDGHSFNLQAGDSMNGFASFTPEKAGTYQVKVGHINDIEVELEFVIE